jgi:hypothetical protein
MVETNVNWCRYIKIADGKTLEKASLEVWEDLITQHSKHIENDKVQLHVMFSKIARKLPKCVHNNCAKFGECHLREVRGVDYTK